MSGVSLNQAPTSFGYACPFCPTVIAEVLYTISPALHAFERHLDFHMDRGDPLLVAGAAAA